MDLYYNDDDDEQCLIIMKEFNDDDDPPDERYIWGNWSKQNKEFQTELKENRQEFVTWQDNICEEKKKIKKAIIWWKKEINVVIV